MHARPRARPASSLELHSRRSIPRDRGSAKPPPLPNPAFSLRPRTLAVLHDYIVVSLVFKGAIKLHHVRNPASPRR